MKVLSFCHGNTLDSTPCLHSVASPWYIYIYRTKSDIKFNCSIGGHSTEHRCSTITSPPFIKAITTEEKRILQPFTNNGDISVFKWMQYFWEWLKTISTTNITNSFKNDSKKLQGQIYIAFVLYLKSTFPMLRNLSHAADSLIRKNGFPCPYANHFWELVGTLIHTSYLSPIDSTWCLKDRNCCYHINNN